MRITRTDAPEEGKKQTQDLEAMDVSELQAKYKEVLGQETISRNKEVLIEQIRRGQFSKEVKEKRGQRKKAAAAKSESATPSTPQRLEDMTTEELQRTLNGLTQRRTLERDRAVLIRMISRLREKQQDQLEAKADAEIEAEAEKPAQTVTQQLVRIANMKLPALRETYQEIFGKKSLSRNRKALLVKIAEKLQADEAVPESPTAPVAKPTLTVKFERKGGKKSGGKSKGRAKGKAAAQRKGTATKRETVRPAGQRDPRLPKAGTDLVREWRGKKYVVRVLESGFEYNSKPYRSLSALAKHITGQIVNGFAWFKLTAKESKKS